MRGAVTAERDHENLPRRRTAGVQNGLSVRREVRDRAAERGVHLQV